jgi:AcrR family transcriptional regulator
MSKVVLKKLLQIVEHVLYTYEQHNDEFEKAAAMCDYAILNSFPSSSTSNRPAVSAKKGCCSKYETQRGQVCKPSARPWGSKAIIIQTARFLFERGGIANTSIVEIVRYAGVARTSFYQHFRDKNHVVHAIFEDYLGDVADTVRVWDALRREVKPSEGLVLGVRSVRQVLYGGDGLPPPMMHVLEEASMRESFRMLAIGQTAAYLAQHVVPGCQAARVIDTHIGYESLCMALAGIAWSLQAKPGSADEAIAAEAAFLLRVDAS